MRLKIILTLIGFCGLTFIACQKELSMDSQSSGPDQSTGGQLVRIQQGTDPDLLEDTVYLLSYNSSNRLIRIVDSLYEDTLNIAYDATGNISKTAWTSGNKSNYSYNANQQIQEINYTIAGVTEKMTFEYVNGVISKGYYYTDPGATGVASLLWTTLQFTVSSGNVTNLKLFDKNGALDADISLTYGTQLNPFKELALLNMGNCMGFDGLFDIYAVFCKNVPAGHSMGLAAGQTQYTFNNSQQPVKAIYTTNVYADMLTWFFQYK